MRDQQERGIAPYDQWRSSAMANSSRDPFWRAVLSAEVAATPSLKATIEEKCTRCHAPMAAPAPLSPPGKILSHLAGDGERSWLGMDGVSCTLCHQIRDKHLGADSTFTGHFVLGEQGPIFGPHADPFTMPMRNHTGYTPTHSQHILSSALCGTCHTLDTDAVTSDGQSTGHRLHEQSPYLEWRNSAFNNELDEPAKEAESCQGCHMPVTDQADQVIRTRIAHNPGGRDFPFLKARSPFGRHTFFGGNVLLTRLLIDNYQQLDVQAPKKSLETRLSAASHFLQHNTARLELGAIQRIGDQVQVPVTVTNLAGHKLPTAYPSRRVWLRMEVRDATDAIVFASGQFDKNGRLVDQEGQQLASEKTDGAILPHFQQIDSSRQAQVYQAIMADADGEPTFTLLRGATYFRDNRILPTGWRASHADASATAPVGTDADTDFGNGQDTVTYQFAATGKSPFTARVWLHYQVLSPRHAAELFRFNTPEISTFRAMYGKTKRGPETLATARQRFE